MFLEKSSPRWPEIYLYTCRMEAYLRVPVVLTLGTTVYENTDSHDLRRTAHRPCAHIPSEQTFERRARRSGPPAPRITHHVLWTSTSLADTHHACLRLRTRAHPTHRRRLPQSNHAQRERAHIRCPPLHTTGTGTGRHSIADTHTTACTYSSPANARVQPYARTPPHTTAASLAAHLCGELLPAHGPLDGRLLHRRW